MSLLLWSNGANTYNWQSHRTPYRLESCVYQVVFSSMSVSLLHWIQTHITDTHTELRSKSCVYQFVFMTGWLLTGKLCLSTGLCLRYFHLSSTCYCLEGESTRTIAKLITKPFLAVNEIFSNIMCYFHIEFKQKPLAIMKTLVRPHNWVFQIVKLSFRDKEDCFANNWCRYLLLSFQEAVLQLSP